MGKQKKDKKIILTIPDACIDVARTSEKYRLVFLHYASESKFY
jgi:hypothetical protein